jgi:hypothetical protein
MSAKPSPTTSGSSTPAAAGQLDERPHKFAGRTSEAQQAQTRNLEIARQRGGPNYQHGAYSQKLQPLREGYLAELSREFPHGSERRLIVQASRLAKLDALDRFTDERGLIRHKRRGEVFPAAALAEKISVAYLAEHERLEAAEREHGAVSGSRSVEALVRWARGEGPRPPEDDDQVEDADVVGGEEGTSDE